MFREIMETLRPPSAEVLAQRELESSRRGLLEAQRNRDFYSKMAEFYAVRIDRLTTQLKECEPCGTPSRLSSAPGLASS